MVVIGRPEDTAQPGFIDCPGPACLLMQDGRGEHVLVMAMVGMRLVGGIGGG